MKIDVDADADADADADRYRPRLVVPSPRTDSQVGLINSKVLPDWWPSVVCPPFQGYIMRGVRRGLFCCGRWAPN